MRKLATLTAAAAFVATFSFAGTAFAEFEAGFTENGLNCVHTVGRECAGDGAIVRADGSWEINLVVNQTFVPAGLLFDICLTRLIGGEVQLAADVGFDVGTGLLAATEEDGIRVPNGTQIAVVILIRQAAGASCAGNATYATGLFIDDGA